MLFRSVFNNAAELAKLNALVHPAVFRAFDHWVAEVPADCPYVLKEAALLFESGSYKMCDRNILVTAETQVRIQRVMERDGVSEQQVRARMDKQMSDEEKMKMTDYILLNQQDHSVILQVLDLHHQFISGL